MMEFRHPDEALFGFRRRVVVAAVFVIVCFGVLAGRLYHLQVAQYDYFHARAEGNRIAVLPVPPDRGVIRDRNGQLLARNYSAYTLEINPAQVRNLGETIDALAEVVKISDNDRRRFRRQLLETRHFDRVPIRTHLNDIEVARLAARLYRFPGVELQSRLFRDYPLGHTGAHVVGYIGRINERDVQRIAANEQTANYRGSEHIGKSGLELGYEQELHGTTGVEQVEVNAAGRAVRSIASIPPVPGNDLELTLDVGLQNAAEEALAGWRGAVVAIEPSSGGVLAMASTPTFDPNLFVDGISFADWRELSDSPDHPMLNRALNSAYPPGSTFKPFMALAGLEYGERSLDERFNNQRVFTYAGRRYVDRKSNCQSGVDMHSSIVYSCNTYYYELADELGIDAISEFMTLFGLGERTGIDVPGEGSGVLPSREWKRSRFSAPEQQRWFGGETISVGIGQGYNSYTPLQMSNALAALLNGGTLHRPHVVRSIVDGTTGERRDMRPLPKAQRAFSAEYLEALREAMTDVTRKGTARNAFQGAPYEAGGKTGTAQVVALRPEGYDAEEMPERLRNHAWFVGFAPAENPSIAVAVLVENGGFGGSVAAPVARKVLDYHLLGAEVEDPVPDPDTLEAVQ